MSKNALFSTLVVVCILPTTSFSVDLPTGSELKTVDFERHVMGLLSKAGCNMGSCHGSFQGKNGFRLSLFGYEPDFDSVSITRDNYGRRINLQEPDQSLFLLKATGRTTHEGGMRFGKDSWMYDVLREWIAKGAKHSPGSGKIEELTISPPDFAVVSVDQTLQVKVTAKFADGTQEDITPFCDFKISDDAIGTVNPLGKVTATQPGDTGLTVLYRGAVRAIRVLVPATKQPGQDYPTLKVNNAIDREVFAKLKLLNMVPSEQSSDLEFLRRVTIDTIGQLPTPKEIRAFESDNSPMKRQKLIDDLLKHPLHAALWATKLSDITGNNTIALESPNGAIQNRRSQLWHDWLRKRVGDNQPYDEMVRDILTATSRDGQKPEQWLKESSKWDEQLQKGFESDYVNKPTLDYFWRRQQRIPVEQWGEKVAAAFLGIRLECAQCHKHPTDRWTQDDYWGFANLFAPITFVNNQFSDNELKKLATAENNKRKEGDKKNNQIINVRELFFATTAESVTRLPRLAPVPMTDRVVEPRTLGGPELPHEIGKDTRADVWKWMREKENPFFAKSFVNRVWGHYFGIGLVNPIDDFSQANPPTNERLLNLLADQFIQSGYDLRELERNILLTQTYQLTSKTNATNQFDKLNFAHSYVRPLMAEQVVDVLNSGLGVEENFGNDAPAGVKMIEVGASRLTNNNLAYVLRIFGRPPRSTACDCERAMEPALPQTLFRMTDPTLMSKLTSKTNRASELAKAKISDEAAIEELFLGTLSRQPTQDEQTEALLYIKAAKSRTEGLQDVLWALINTREFILNH